MSVDKSSVLKKLRESDAIYVLMSDCTRMPFVVCDPETYDDEVFIFFSEEDAMRGGQEFLKANNPLKIFNIEKKYLLPFYSSLFPIGVNCMVIGKGTEEEIAIQLGELVRRPEQKPGEEPIENPELQITAMYFMQKVRSQKELKLTEDKKMPILNKDDGQVLMPIFTDVQEFLKFQNENRDMKYTMGVVEAARIPEAMGPEVTGVVVNRFGIDLQLNVSRPQK